MAYVLSSVSGNLISAASAGFAPTNSADVSAIASAYQVVSATATQLYAGTAYVTSVNDNPISASRAGNAANASLANSAYYDGTGRLISALPDEATVSAIASAYADSAASGKLDKTAQVVTAIGTGWNSDDDEIVSAVNGCILSADEARYAGAAGSSNYARYDRRTNVPGYRTISSLPGSAEVSAIASAYAESAVSSVSGNYYTTANESGYALSSDVSATVDLVGTQSANWGGSALALSAGPGVKLEKVDNTLVASTDETLLWSASGYVVGDSSQSITLSESPLNFNTVRIYGYRPLGAASPCGVFSDDIDIQWLKANSVNQLSCPYTIRADTTQYMGSFELSGITSTTWVEGGWHCSLANTAAIATNGVYAHLHKVVGINRTAEA